MTAKDCGHNEHRRRKLLRYLFAGLLAFVILVLLVVFIVWLTLRPENPHLVLQDATVYVFNISSGASLLSSTFQITLSSRNPNDHIGIYYDRVDVYAAYRGQQITMPTLLPPTYQGHKDFTVWSPFLFGNSVPIAPFYNDALIQDQFAGTVMISIKVSGRIRWKVGTFITGKYHLNANCPAYINLGTKNNGGIIVGPGPAIKYQLVQTCHVDI